MLLDGLSLLENELKEKFLLDEITDDARIKYLRTTKMFMFLMIEFMSDIQNKQSILEDNYLDSGILKVNKDKIFLELFF